jgi:isopentenyl-diphosphate delta-isomerase
MARITIVDQDDNVISSEERDVARAKGLRHRIVRVFAVNDKGKILLQKRNSQLKDSPGKWDQSVGGHVDEGEDYITAARRETSEELGIEVEDFRELGKFYIERPAQGGIIRRFQTVFTCIWNEPVHFNKTEIAEVKWLSVQEIDNWLARSPEDFTKNFATAFLLLKQYNLWRA